MSGDVIDLTARKAEQDKNTPHLAGSALCGACGHEWAAVAPVGTVHLDCPNCKRCWGVFKSAVEPTTPTWRCNCGEQLFWILPGGPQCRRCGVMVTGWF